MVVTSVRSYCWIRAIYEWVINTSVKWFKLVLQLCFCGSIDGFICSYRFLAVRPYGRSALAMFWERRLLKFIVFIWIYRLVALPLLLLATPVFVWKMRRRGGYRDGFGTRFGLGLRLPPKNTGVQRIWLQAVSMGEMLAMEPLLLALADDPKKEVFLTATTSTGYAMALEKYEEIAVGVAYFPLDFWPFMRRAWRKIDPDLAIVAETEIWPEYLEQARVSGTKVVLANGRLSDSGHKSMRRLANVFRRQISSLSRILAGSELDVQRFRSIGISGDRVEMAGNLKIDVDFSPVLDVGERDSLRRSHGLGKGFVLLGASTWAGEEDVLLEALRVVRTVDSNARLLIVPRHGERRGEIRRLLRERAEGFSFQFKTDGLPEGEVDIMVCDTHGELRMLTQLADVAFIGRSLPPHTEGQTPVECGALGVPAVMGPGMSNFRSIRSQLLEAGAARQVEDGESLVQAILSLHGDEAAREAMSSAGKAWHSANRGSLQRHLDVIEQELNS